MNDSAERRAANRAVGVSALGLAVTGVVELIIALVTGSVGLLGDALHNLSDVSTSLVVFLCRGGLWRPGRVTDEVAVRRGRRRLRKRLAEEFGRVVVELAGDLPGDVRAGADRAGIGLVKSRPASAATTR